MNEIFVMLDKESQHVRRIKEAVELINASQRHFFLRFCEESIDIEKLEEIINGERVINGKKLAAHISDSFSGYKIIYITDRKFHDNWFSHEDRRCSVITTFGWEGEFSPPSLRAYLIYQIAQAIIPLEADLSESMLLNMVHEPPIGCLHDFNLNKSDIRYGMMAGNICYNCEGALRIYGVEQIALDSIHRILAVVRNDVIGRGYTVDISSSFVIMRFTNNNENNNAFKHGIKPGLEDVGLKVHRNDDIVQPAQILDQVLQNIRRSRFIVAKIDEVNLNVYFELGLAMGLDKDVLLVSESELVVNLPTNLNNWECLTYEKGNYEQLQNRISNFFKCNYHLQVTGSAERISR